MEKLYLTNLTLTDEELKTLSLVGKGAFRNFCKEHDLRFHFPDEVGYLFEQQHKEMPAYFLSVDLFNRTNKDKVYVINGKYVSFVYDFGGTDIDYKIHDPVKALETMNLFEKENNKKAPPSALILFGLVLLFFGFLFDKDKFSFAWGWLLVSVVWVWIGNYAYQETINAKQRALENKAKMDLLKIRRDINGS